MAGCSLERHLQHMTTTYKHSVNVDTVRLSWAARACGQAHGLSASSPDSLTVGRKESHALQDMFQPA